MTLIEQKAKEYAKIHYASPTFQKCIGEAFHKGVELGLELALKHAVAFDQVPRSYNACSVLPSSITNILTLPADGKDDSK